MIDFLPVLLFFSVLIIFNMIFFKSRYKRVPPNKALVVYGKTHRGDELSTYTGGAAFVWPVIQHFSYLDLSMHQIDVDLGNVNAKDGRIRQLSAKFKVAISSTPEILQVAARFLLDRSQDEVRGIAEDIIIGETKNTIKNNNTQALVAEEEEFMQQLFENIESELNKLGMNLINMNIINVKIAQPNSAF